MAKSTPPIRVPDPYKVRVFIEEVGLGRQPTTAARRAGFGTPHRDAKRLLEDPEIVEAIRLIQVETSKKSEMAREDVMTNLLRAFRIAEQMDDPQSMIRAMAEVNRMCGHYAPEKKVLEVTGEILHMQQQLEELPKEKLLELLGEAEETPLLEAMPNEAGLFIVEDEDAEV